MTEQYFISSPVHSMQGDIVVPGDKSISHRAIMLGAIAEGITTVEGFLDGEDCLATLHAFESMGVCIEKPAGHPLVIHGVGKYGLKTGRHTELWKFRNQHALIGRPVIGTAF